MPQGALVQLGQRTYWYQPSNKTPLEAHICSIILYNSIRLTYKFYYVRILVSNQKKRPKFSENAAQPERAHASDRAAYNSSFETKYAGNAIYF